MADAITIQELIDARTDAKTLEEAVNGDAVTTVLSRLGETYPTLSNALSQIDGKLDSADAQIKQAITDLFQNGGLPATPFATKALMEASALVDGDYAMVTDDTVNNGLYVKTAGAWVKSGYDPLTQAKAYTDTNKADILSKVQNTFDTKALMTASPLPDGSRAFVGSDTEPDNNGFYKKIASVWEKTPAPAPKKVKRYDTFESGYVDLGGNNIPSTTVLRSPVLRLKSGTVLKFVRVGSYQFGFRTSATPLVSTPIWRAESSLEHTITESEPYIRFYMRNSNSTTPILPSEASNLKITADFSVLYEDTLSLIDANSSAVANKANAVSYIDHTSSLEMGYVDGNGDDIASTIYAMTPIYKMPPNTVIELSRVGSYQFGFSSSANSKVLHTAGQWYTETNKTFTVTADKPYVRIFLRNITADTLATAKQLISARTVNPVVYKQELSQSIADIQADVDRVPLTFDPLFRTPSQAIGGVMSIIDDDGRTRVLTELYPQLKAAGVPFGIAVVPQYLGTNGYMSVEDIDNLSTDFNFVEILNHTFTHTNMVTSGSVQDREKNVLDAKKWFYKRGYTVNGFVLPYGSDNPEALRIVQKHHVACYDYSGGGVETFDTMRNQLISRAAFGLGANNVTNIKLLIDQAAANNGWFNLCTHTGHPSYWQASSSALQLAEIIDYAKSKGIRFMKPHDAFQVFGNIVENDSGFKIQANGKIVGAT